jgi:hypothetical protein
MREAIRPKGVLAFLVIAVVFALLTGTFGEILDIFRVGPDPVLTDGSFVGSP